MAEYDVTTPAQYARLAKRADKASDYDWSTNVRVDPAIWHAILDQYPDLDNTVVDNDYLPLDVVDRLANSSWEFIRWQLWTVPEIGEDTLERLLHDIEPSVRNSMSYRHDITLNKLLELAKDFYPHRGNSVARVLKERFAVHWLDVDSSGEIRRVQPYDQPAIFKQILAKAGYPDLDPMKPSASDDWLKAICAEEDVGMWVAFSGFADADIIHAIAVNGCWHCQRAVARSPFARPSTLAWLTFALNRDAQEYAAMNPATDLPTLVWLLAASASGNEPVTRFALESRFGIREYGRPVPVMPSGIDMSPIQSHSELQNLYSSPNIQDRLRARFAPFAARFRPTANGRKGNMVRATASFAAPDDLLFQYLVTARDFRPWERPIDHVAISGRADLTERLALNQNRHLRAYSIGSGVPSLAILRHLNHDRDEWIRRSAHQTLAQNDGESDWYDGSSSSHDVISTLDASNPSERRSYSNMKVSAGVWREVLQTRPDLAKWVAINETVGPHLLDELADWPDAEVRGWVAEHPRVWLKTLVRLGQDPDPDVRRYAVHNARMPDNQLRRMTYDTEPLIRDEATRRLAARAYVNRLLVDPHWWRHLGNGKI